MSRYVYTLSIEKPSYHFTPGSPANNDGQVNYCHHKGSKELHLSDDVEMADGQTGQTATKNFHGFHMGMIIGMITGSFIVSIMGKIYIIFIINIYIYIHTIYITGLQFQNLNVSGILGTLPWSYSPPCKVTLPGGKWQCMWRQLARRTCVN